MDDPRQIPVGGRSDVSEARRMRDHKLKVLVLCRKMEAAGVIGRFLEHRSRRIVDVAVLDVDLRPGDSQCDFGPGRGKVVGVTTFAATFFPLVSSKSIDTLPSLLLISRETRGLITVGFDANEMRNHRVSGGSGTGRSRQ